jgi:TPR repeat protein
MRVSVHVCRRAGDALAQFRLGEHYLQGTIGGRKDELESIKWLRRAVDQKHAGAQYQLGVCLLQGVGLLKQETEGRALLALSAEQGHALAQFRLAQCYLTGSGCSQVLLFSSFRYHLFHLQHIHFYGLYNKYILYQVTM